MENWWFRICFIFKILQAYLGVDGPQWPIFEMVIIVVQIIEYMMLVYVSKGNYPKVFFPRIAPNNNQAVWIVISLLCRSHSIQNMWLVTKVGNSWPPIMDIHGWFRCPWPYQGPMGWTICHQTWDDWYNCITHWRWWPGCSPLAQPLEGYHLSQNVARLIVLDC